MRASFQRVDSRIRVGRRIDNMAPVEQRGDAGIDLVKRPDQVADIDILRGVKPNHLADQHAEIMVEGPVRGDAAQRRLPKVKWPLIKSGHGDHATAVDLDHRPTTKVSTDRDDLAIVDQYVAGLDDAELCIHRNNGCALHSYSRQHGASSSVFR